MVESSGFHPGGHKGKLHRELHVPDDQPIPHARLEQAMHSQNREVRNDAIRADTMEHWSHAKRKHHAKRRFLAGRTSYSTYRQEMAKA